MLQKSRKILYFSAAIWKKIFVFKKKNFFKTSEKFIYSRSSTIPRLLVGIKFFIHTGKKWVKKTPTRWIVGFKFGALTWNRRLALYKAKQMRKKKLKQNKSKQIRQNR